MKNDMLIWTAAFMMLVVLVSSTQATIQWNYDSPLTVYETITDIGNNYYRYEYSFTNTDTSPIWCFGLFTRYITDEETTFQGFLGCEAWLNPVSVSVNDTYPEYNGENLDSNIIDVIISYYEVGRAGVSGPAIQVGETAFDFSLVSRYDNLPKYYFYETIASGYSQTNGTGKVAAVGTTIPEPCTILLLSCGGIILRRRFRA